MRAAVTRLRSDEVEAAALYPPWPAWQASLVAWLLPATVARRTEYLPLFPAFRAHLVATVLTLPPALLIVNLAHPYEFHTALESFRGQPVLATLAAIAVFPLLEIQALALAAMITAWGARVEKPVQSFRHALRQTWLHSLHTPVAVALCLVAIQQLDAFAPGLLADSGAPRRGESLYRLYRPVLIPGLYVAALAWILWSLMRAVATPRSARQLQRPLSCEQCGYDLTAIPLDARCPECGEAVGESMSAQKRTGVPWQHRRRLGLIRAYLATTLPAITRPERLGRQLRLYTPVAAHRHYLAMHLPAVFMISTLGALLIARLVVGDVLLRRDLEFFLLGSVWVGGGVTLGSVLGLSAMAGLVGAIFWARERRAVMPAAMQMAGYMAGVMMICAVVAWGMLAAISGGGLLTQQLSGVMFRSVDLGFVIWSALMLVLTALFMLNIAHGVSAARYANR